MRVNTVTAANGFTGTHVYKIKVNNLGGVFLRKILLEGVLAHVCDGMKHVYFELTQSLKPNLVKDTVQYKMRLVLCS